MKKTAKKAIKKAKVTARKQPIVESTAIEDKKAISKLPVVESAIKEETKVASKPPEVDSVLFTVPVHAPKMSEFKMDFDSMGKYSDYMYDFVARILKEVGPRAPCSLAEQKAAYLVHDELKQTCDEAHMEDFYCYPRAFLGWIKLAILTLVIGFVLFLLTPIGPVEQYAFTLIPLAFGAFGVTCIYKQFLMYEEWTPKFLPYKQGHSQNVIGTFKPIGEVKKRVIYSAHLDSAFKFDLIQWTKAGYAFFLFGGIMALVTFILLYIIQLFLNFANSTPSDATAVSNFFNWLVFILPLFMGVFIMGAGKNKKIFYGAFRHLNGTARGLIIGNCIWVVFWFILFQTSFLAELTIFNSVPMVKTALLAVILDILPINALIFFVDKKATPGAIDNLTGVAISMCMAKVLQDWREKYPEKYPKNTEVKVAIVGCEEVGLRGSEAYAKRHADDFNSVDTTCVNLESISDVKIVTIFTEEKTTGTKLSPEVYKLLDQCATELNIRHNLDHMPGVAGGTDAAGFVRGGLRASSLCGLKYKDYLAYYHTDRDNLDVYNKERRPWTDHGHTWQERNIRGALEKALCICVRYLEKKDADDTPYVSPTLKKCEEDIRRLSPKERLVLAEHLLEGSDSKITKMDA